MRFLGRNFASSLICTVNIKKTFKKPLKKLKILKTYLKNSKKPRFFPALVVSDRNRIGMKFGRKVLREEEEEEEEQQQQQQQAD